MLESTRSRLGDYPVDRVKMLIFYDKDVVENLLNIYKRG